MCGIFSCISQQPQNLIDKTLQSLKILEYRGYDSAGITYRINKTQSNIPALNTIKSVGDIDELTKKVENRPTTTLCIGHTRWATNGVVNTNNSHPHLSFNGEIAVVHNGIIENYSECCDLLKANDIKLKTPVDTEVIPNILYLLHNNKHNIHKYLQGQYVFCATDIYSENLFLAKKGNLPLYIGRDQNTIYVTSDTLALPQTTTEIITMDNLDTCEIYHNNLLFFNNGHPIQKNWTQFNQSFIASDKNGFSTYMEKEINEIPDIMQRIISSYSTDKTILQQIQALRAQIKNYNCIHICGCGTSYHAALILSKVFEKELQIRTIAHVSSELNQTTLLNEEALAIVISQSGETADTLACMDILQNQKIPIIALCNITTSTIAKRSNITFPLLCGPEIAVASTKVFCAAILVGCLIIKDYPSKIYNEFIQNTRKTLQSARKILHFPNTNDFSKIFIIGKGIAHALALESALKIKEVSYIHCEGYPANELKHGPLSMVDTTTLAITIGDNASNAAAEIQARGGTVVNLPIDNKNPLNFIEQIIPVQIFALDLAQTKGINPDKPRNLAKSVTVL